ncbi:MAG: nicotinate-nucleotide--dimethylbenzimidazole phosphoribosyltransferase, partial [Chloroflexi bacterium]|nr:nicotinate-nucleotide--dimethylbenzimidazole phosphoribosyltransferase [Chloroflexota bacterium]
MQLPIIPPLDSQEREEALDRQAILTKPLGALGKLETLSANLVAMTGRMDWRPERRAIILAAGDHGVVKHGVSAYPQEVTAQMVHNFIAGGAAINVIARQMNARLRIIDAGVAAPLPPEVTNHPSFVDAKAGLGTADFTIEPALTSAQAEQVVQAGIDELNRQVEQGLDIVAVGEMGIG